jgi:MinD superfamily P-loop ATPase
MLGLHQVLPRPLEYWRTNYHAVVDVDACTMCGACQNRCQVNAIFLTAKNKPAVVDKHLCIGCGQCVSICPAHAITLAKIRSVHTPPQDREELIDIIMAEKKTAIAKMLLTARLVFDALRTGRTDFLAGRQQ